jgi:hypothetical protein
MKIPSEIDVPTIIFSTDQKFSSDYDDDDLVQKYNDDVKQIKKSLDDWILQQRSDFQEYIWKQTSYIRYEKFEAYH